MVLGLLTSKFLFLKPAGFTSFGLIVTRLSRVTILLNSIFLIFEALLIPTLKGGARNGNAGNIAIKLSYLLL